MQSVGSGLLEMRIAKRLQQTASSWQLTVQLRTIGRQSIYARTSTLRIRPKYLVSSFGKLQGQHRLRQRTSHL
jgi:hypothetical protein